MLYNLTILIATTCCQAFTHCVFSAFVAVSYLFFLVSRWLSRMFYRNCLIYLMETFLLQKRVERICLLKEKCAQIVSLEAKKPVAGQIPSLSLCHFAKLQFPKNEESRCENHYPVRQGTVNFLN